MSNTESGGELAVRMAIGEAHVIAENKEFFVKHGVDINALESTTSSSTSSKRSPTTLLVKNLPPDVNEADLEANFARFDNILLLILYIEYILILNNGNELFSFSMLLLFFLLLLLVLVLL